MEEFQKKLKEASNALILLSREFEKLECKYSDILCCDYPFDRCLSEIVHGMLNWQETINDHLEALNLEESANG